MDRRVFLVSTLSTSLVLGYFFVAKPKLSQADQAPQAKPAATVSGAAVKPGADKNSDGKPAELTGDKAPPTEAAKPAAAAAATPPAKPAPHDTVLEVPGYYRATFTNYGGVPLSWVLLNPQYKEDNPRKSNRLAEPIDLVRTVPPKLPLALSFPAVEHKSTFSIPEDAVWTEEPRGADGSIAFSWTNGDVRVVKRFAPLPDSYEVHLTVTVENNGDKAATFYPRMSMYGWHDPQVKSGFLRRRVSQTEGLCLVDGKLKKANLEDMIKKSNPAKGGWGEAVDETNNKIRWFGIGEQYFVMAAALKLADDGRRCEVGGFPSGDITANLTLDEQTVKPHGKTEQLWSIFVGPKLLSRLDTVTVGGEDAEMGKAIDFGWTEAVARPMLAVLKAIHAVLPNWGVAIIVLTILLKALTWIPTQRSMKSMKAMAKLKPEMDKLKDKYGDDKNGMNIAMMELYKKHGVNPLGGCLPVLIQMPIYIALYSMLGNSVELYRSGFFGWIRDLTAADPYFVLPILTGVLMFVQQKTQPNAAVDPQQKTMMYMMPVMFTAFSFFLPSGLTIYILTNTLLTFLQQFIMNRGDKSTTQPLKPARA